MTIIFWEGVEDELKTCTPFSLNDEVCQHTLYNSWEQGGTAFWKGSIQVCKQGNPFLSEVMWVKNKDLNKLLNHFAQQMHWSDFSKGK